MGITVTKSGLSAVTTRAGGMTTDGSGIDVELWAGTPEHFRIVGIDGTEAGKTKFGLVALVLPKDEDGGGSFLLVSRVAGVLTALKRPGAHFPACRPTGCNRN